MDSQIDLSLPVPSLRYMCLIKTAVTLCSKYEIQIEEDVTMATPTNLIKYKVEDNASTLGLPYLLLKDLWYVLERISFELDEWIEYHHPEMGFFDPHVSRLRFNTKVLSEYLSRIQWTVYGTINRSAMVRAFVKEPRLDLLQRFRMACQFCLEDCIQDLWPELESIPEEMFNGNPLDQFWYDRMKTKTKKFDYSSVFEYSFDHFFVEAVKYFWDKMSQEEHAGSLTKVLNFLSSIATSEEFNFNFIKSIRHIVDNARFIFQNISRKILREFFTAEPLNVFYIRHMLSSCPLGFFMESIKPLFDHLNGECYLELLKDLAYFDDSDGDIDNDLGEEAFKFSWEIAKGSPDIYSYLTSWESFISIFKSFSCRRYSEDPNSFMLMVNFFKCLEEDKKLFVLSEKGLIVCKLILNSRNLTNLKKYLQICVNSRTTALKLFEYMDINDIYWYDDEKKARLSCVIEELFPLEKS